MTFLVTHPGEYRQRDGTKALVEKRDECVGGSVYPWVGSLSTGKQCTWMVTGRVVRGETTDKDLVAPWTEPFAITAPGEYRTRDGRKAVVLCVDAPHQEETVIGYEASSGRCRTWGSSGSYYPDGNEFNGLDLVGVWQEPVTWTRWFNVNPEYVSEHDTREHADLRRAGERLACRQLHFDGTRITDITPEDAA